MANQIMKAEDFLPIIDGIYKNESYTSFLDTQQLPGYFSGVNKIHIMKVSTTGLGNYDRETGYPKGDVTASFEEMILTQERGKMITVDNLDNEEALGMVFGAVIGDFVRVHVVPELDAYRFTKYVSGAGNANKETGVKLDGNNILNAVNEAIIFQNANEVPEEGRILFINSNLMFEFSDAVANRTLTNEDSANNVIRSYNGIPVKYVTPQRFYSEITLNDGTKSKSYEKGTNGKDINFILMRKDAIYQGVVFADAKIFDPKVNQLTDSWMYQYRNYHDIKVLDNKKTAIYASVSTE